MPLFVLMDGVDDARRSSWDGWAAGRADVHVGRGVTLTKWDRSYEEASLAIAADGKVLMEAIDALSAKLDLPSWPAEARAALGAALHAEVPNRYEAEKAARLATHLFAGPAPTGLFEASSPPSRHADRLRADLADLTPFGAGLFLLDRTPPCGSAEAA